MKHTFMPVLIVALVVSYTGWMLHSFFPTKPQIPAHKSIAPAMICTKSLLEASEKGLDLPRAIEMIKHRNQAYKYNKAFKRCIQFALVDLKDEFSPRTAFSFHYSIYSDFINIYGETEETILLSKIDPSLASN